MMKRKKYPMSVESCISRIESAIFEADEPGMRDTDNGDLVLTEIGVIRLRKILKEFRDGKANG